MPQPQNSPRGSFGKKKISIGNSNMQANSTGIYLSAGLALSGKSTALITQNSTGVIMPAGIALSAQTDMITANSTAVLILPTVSALPETRVVGGIAFVSNSTGQSLAFHSTGTTWVYPTKTSVLA